MEDNVTINDNYEYNDNPNQQEYDEKKRKRRLLLLLLLLLFSIILILGVTGLYVEHKGNRNLSNAILNIDIDGDGIADINIDNGTGKCLVNCSTDNKKPITNIDYKKNNKPTFNIDTNEDGNPDSNLINQDTNGDGKCNLNCDTNNDGWPDTNLDLDNDAECDINCDTNNDGKCELNCDTNGDGKCDLYCDTNGDGVCDEKCDDPSIDIIEGEEYVLTLTDSSTYNKNNIIPGWTGSKSFKLSNSTTSPQVVNMNWINVKNTFTTVNNLYYSVSRNNVTLIKNARAPYKDSNIISNITIPAKTTYTFKFSFEFKNTNLNQDIDKGKSFDAKIKIIVKQ